MKKKTRVSRHRVITLLGRAELDFMDKLGKDALFSTGRKLSYNDILRGLLHFAMEIGISGEGISSFKDLKEKILEGIKKTQAGEGFPTPYEILTDTEGHLKEQSLKTKTNTKNE